MNEIGESLKNARDESGISVEEASNDLGIKKEYLENIEGGKIGAFKDIFELKEYIISYAKYLGLDENKLINEFNEYMFEYTSKIPVKEIEKAVIAQNKEEKKEDKVVSPYTREVKKKDHFMIIILIIVIIISILTIIWSIKQITVDKKVATEISYVR